MELKDLLIESKEFDTRDQTPLFVYRFSETVELRRNNLAVAFVY